jgi:hypothetical protein
MDEGAVGSPRSPLTTEESIGEIAPVWIPDQRVAFCQVNPPCCTLLTLFQLAGLQHQVPADGAEAPLPVLRRCALQPLLGQQGAHQVPAVRESQGLQRLLRST